MANRYCDHGAYGAASFTATMTSSVMTVTAVASGVIGVGSLISGPGVLEGTQVSSLGTGTGGTGTYNVSNVNVSTGAAAVGTSTAMTSVYGQPHNIGVVGVPQEGDGLERNPSTATATAFIEFSAAPTTGTISVCGVAITTTGIIGAASASAAATALAAAINGSTNGGQLPVGAGVSDSLPQLRNLLFAVASGARVTLSMRTGAASLNYNPNTNCQIATTFNNLTSTATNHQFAGGVSGCYGLINNLHGTIWPQAISQCAYGVLGATLAPLAGKVPAGDTVKIRCKTIPMRYNALGGGDFAPVPGGTPSNPIIYEADDGTVWPEDGANPILKFTVVTNSNNSFIVGNSSNTTFAHFKGKKYQPSGQRNWVFEVTNNTLNNLRTCMIYMSGGYVFESLDFIGKVGASITYHSRGSVGTSGPAMAIDCRLQWEKEKTTAGNTFFNNGSINSNMSAVLKSCEFELVSPSAPMPGVFDMAQQMGSHRYLLENCTFKGFMTGTRLHAETTNIPVNGNSLYLRDCDLGNISVLGPTYRGATLQNDQVSYGGHGIVLYNSRNKQEFMHDTANGMVAWSPQQSYLTLNAKLRDGVTPWSIRVCPNTATGTVHLLNPIILPTINKINSLETGIRTLTLNFLAEKSWTLARSDVSFEVTYTGTDDVQRSVWTHLTAATPVTNALPWSGIEVDPADSVQRPKFSDQLNGNVYFNRYGLSVTTPTAIKTGTDISVVVRVGANPSTANVQFFIDPEVLVT